MSSVSPSIEQQLIRSGQEHVLHYWDELSSASQTQLLKQIESIDFDIFDQLVEMKQCDENQSADTDILPSPFISVEDGVVDWEEVDKVGQALIRQGKLGVLTVAGGQGTRLGWSGPKGTYPATPVTGKSLFQMIAEQILFASKKYKVTIPWYIMTSIENDEITRSFLLDNNCFGLDRTDIFVFPQGVVPAIDAHGKMLLAEKDQIFIRLEFLV